MKRYLSVLLFTVALNYPVLSQSVNCDSCVRAYCCGLAKKKCKTKVKVLPKTQEINICVTNPCCFDFKPCEIKPVYIKSETSGKPSSQANTPIWVGIAALLVTLFSIYMSKKNIQSQIEASQKNLEYQIGSNRNLELEKREIDNSLKVRLELRDICAKFLNAATNLNSKLDEIIYSDIEEGRNEIAQEKYDKTENLRNELKGYYYSLRVMLDGNGPQKKIEDALNEYMKATSFEPDLEKRENHQYTQPLGKLFHLVKAIIHPNYQPPQ